MSFAAFSRTWGKLKFKERGYSNNPKDRGGPTKFGVTEMVARANGYDGDMRNLDEETAKRIAKRQYWDLLNLDSVTVIAGEPLAHEMMDTGYNMGTATVGRYLQRWLNVLNREGRDYPDLLPDGGVGPITLHRLRGFITKRGEDGKTVLFRALNGSQANGYLEIAERNPSQEEFVFGWLLHRVE